MKINNALPKLLVILIAIVSMASCEEDLGTIGSEIIGDQDVNATLDASRTIRSYSKKLQAVQTNGLETNQLGIYTDPVYGMSKINLLSQVALGTPNPSFNFVPELDSVVLYLPFFSVEETEDEVTTYTLDSIYGDTPMKINMYESNYFLRDFDPITEFESSQNYYSNQNTLFQNFRGPLIHTIDDFVPSNDTYIEITETEDDDATDGIRIDTLTLPPGLRVKLPIAFFEDKILDKIGTPELLNNNSFREYFRGIFFEVEGTGDNLMKFNLLSEVNGQPARIDVHYNSRFTAPNLNDSITAERTNGSLRLLFNAINVNVFDNDLNPQIKSDLQSQDLVNGEERLYVRGGDGIITFIELFGDDNDDNGVPDELDEIRQNNWLINEANLILYVDENMVAEGDKEPERLIVFDAENGSLLTDYNLDITASEVEQVDAYTTHLGRLDRGSDETGSFYKIKITNHISSLIHQDSTNVRLGVISSQNVVAPGFQNVLNISSQDGERVPSSSVMSHEGTVLYGNTAADESKRLKLQIYYTESN